MLKFSCPHCDQHITAESSDAGAVTQCPSCGGEIVVPAATSEVVVEMVAMETSAEIPAAPIAPSDTNRNPEPTPGAEAEDSFADRMKEGAKEGWGGIKRHSKQVALKAQIEKLRNVDLRRAYHELGKKCFETGIFEDVLSEQFQAIRDLDAKIVEKREKAEVKTEETKMATLKRKGMDAAHASHAQALTVKREHLITELGRQANATKTEDLPDSLKDDFTAIADIEGRIYQKEAEIRRLRDEPKNRIPGLTFGGLWKWLIEPAFPLGHVQITRIGLAGKRLIALLVDGIVAFAILFLFATFIVPYPTVTSGAMVLIGVTLLFCVYLILMESSRLMATGGKLLLGLRVVDERGQRITAREATLRSAVLGFLIIPFILVPVRFPRFYELLENIGDQSMVLTSIIVAVYALYFSLSLLTKNNRAPHDLLSQTRVVPKGMAQDVSGSMESKGLTNDDHGYATNIGPLPSAAGTSDSTTTPSSLRRFDWRFAIGVLVAVGCTAMIIISINGSKDNRSDSYRHSVVERSDNRAACARCRGSGQLVGTCIKCTGTGIIMTGNANSLELNSSRSQPMQVPCPQCRGSGQMPVPCNRCRGSGKSQ